MLLNVLCKDILQLIRRHKRGQDILERGCLTDVKESLERMLRNERDKSGKEQLTSSLRIPPVR